MHALVLSKVEWFIGFLFPLNTRSIATVKKLLKSSAAAVYLRYVSSKDILNIGRLLPYEWTLLNTFKIFMRQCRGELQLYSTHRKNNLLNRPSIEFCGSMLDHVTKEFNTFPEDLRLKFSDKDFILHLRNYLLSLKS